MKLKWQIQTVRRYLHNIDRGTILRYIKIYSNKWKIKRVDRNITKRYQQTITEGKRNLKCYLTKRNLNYNHEITFHIQHIARIKAVHYQMWMYGGIRVLHTLREEYMLLHSLWRTNWKYIVCLVIHTFHLWSRRDILKS